ncbi:MAG: TonB-dependent receptor [Flavobacteriales bacterium]
MRWTLLLRGLTAAFLFFLLLPASAQRPGGARPAIGRVYGRVLDATNKSAVEFSTVSALALGKDSVLGGALVRSNGDFALEHLPPGPLRVRVAFMGYKTIEHQVRLTPDRMEQDLGNLMLEPDEVVLKEAEVTRDRATQVLQVDRRTYNVEKDLSVKGGSATEVMKNIPGLTVDADGNVELRGKNPLVMVDGRPTTMTLDQIPADDIERVEVITNPSVVFDASTTGGIVNVVMKKSTRPGYSGQLQAGAGSYDRYTAGANLQMREGRTNVNLSYNFNTSNNPSSGYTDRTDLLNGVATDFFDQDTRGRNKRTNHSGRISIDRKLSNRNTISLSQSVNFGEFDNREQQHFTNYGAEHDLVSLGDQLNTQANRFSNFTSQVAFRRTTRITGKEWTTDLTYNLGSRDNSASFVRNERDPDGALLPPGTNTQRSIGTGKDQRWTWQADVTDASHAKHRSEWGFKSSVGRSSSDLGVTNSNDTLGLDVHDAALSNAYRITDIVNAAYFNWSAQLDSAWSLQAGLRAEQTWFEAERTDLDQRYAYKYPDGLKDLGKAIFPALYLVRRWPASADRGLARELQVNLSRKINRPNWMQVMPFIMFSDARSYRIGNPALAPEISTIGEVNHLLPFNGGNWLTSVFARWTQNVITNYAYPLATDPNVLVTTFVNGNDNWTYGWENTVKLTPWKGIELTLNGNVQWVTIGLTQGTSTLTNSGWFGNAKANLSQRFAKDLILQVNVHYEGPRPIPQGHSLEQHSMDVTLSKEFSKKLSVNASVNDVFNQRRWGTAYETVHFTQDISRRRDMRNFRVTATWKFGQQDASLFRRKQQQQHRDPGATNGDDGGF